MRFSRYIFVLLIFSIILSGCVAEQKRDRVNTISIENTKAGTSAEKQIEPEIAKLDNDQDQEQEINDFSLIIEDTAISLGSWDINLYNILGKPLSETIRVLGNGADTHTGSYIKTLTYKGLILNLFSPKDNGKEFWIMNMNLTGKSLKTPRDITVGSTVTELKQSYKNILQVQDGRTDINNCAYTVNFDEKYVSFEVEKGVVKEVSLYIEIP